jgi:hypothetical protein
VWLQPPPASSELHAWRAFPILARLQDRPEKTQRSSNDIASGP